MKIKLGEISTFKSWHDLLYFNYITLSQYTESSEKIFCKFTILILVCLPTIFVQNYGSCIYVLKNFTVVCSLELFRSWFLCTSAWCSLCVRGICVGDGGNLWSWRNYVKMTLKSCKFRENLAYKFEVISIIFSSTTMHVLHPCKFHD